MRISEFYRLAIFLLSALLILSIHKISHYPTFLRSNPFSRDRVIGNSPLLQSIPGELKVMTFNLHDLFLFAHHRKRIQAVAKFLCSEKPHLVGLQEAFELKDREYLYQKLARCGSYHLVESFSGYVGTGLVILSAFPVKEYGFEVYKDRGHPLKILQGDYLAGKGSQWAKIQFGGQELTLFNTHLIAKYGDLANDPIRESQLRQMIHKMKELYQEEKPFLFLGDFNHNRDLREEKLLFQEFPSKSIALTKTVIDQIYIPSEQRPWIEVLKSYKIRNFDGIEMSDHHAIISLISYKFPFLKN